PPPRALTESRVIPPRTRLRYHSTPMPGAFSCAGPAVGSYNESLLQRSLMRSSFGLLCIGLMLTARISADTIPADGGPIVVTPMVHASVQIEHAGLGIQVDPWGAIDLSSAKPADLILVTDCTIVHHLDPAAIRRLRKPAAPVVMPSTGHDKIDKPTVLGNGESTTAAGVQVQAIGAYDI